VSVPHAKPKNVIAQRCVRDNELDELLYYMDSVPGALCLTLLITLTNIHYLSEKKMGSDSLNLIDGA
jgi:hypothetical protein